MMRIASAVLLVISSASLAAATPWMVVDPEQGSVPLSSGSTGAQELSGITWIGGDQYYTVSDQTQQMFPLTIDVNPATGHIDAASLAPGVSLTGHDLEEIVFHPPTGNVLVADETGPHIRMHTLPGGTLVQTLALPPVFNNIRPNLSLEALTWDDSNGFLWTANEEALTVDGPISSFTAGTVVRLQRFDSDFNPNGQWAYVTDPLPGDIANPGRDVEVSGVVALVALPDGELIVMERALGFGALLRHRLYQVDFDGATDTSAMPGLDGETFTPVTKTLLWSRVVAFANLEGAALGPTLDDGSISLVLVSDNGGNLAQILYPLTVRPLVCGDGVVGGDEECDDGNLVDGDGCTADCRLEFCGDGIINNAGQETCDDGNNDDGDGCSADCRVERPVQVCQDAIGKAGRGYADARAKALQRCRNQLNKGRSLFQADRVTPIAGPQACAAERLTAARLERATGKMRMSAARRCTAAAVAVLSACADDLASLIGSGSTNGCIESTHTLAVDEALAAQYGAAGVPGTAAARRCQEEIAKGGTRYVSDSLLALQTCRSQYNRGRPLYADPGKTQPILLAQDCPAERRTQLRRQRAAEHFRRSLTRGCSDASVAALDSLCSTTVDGLVAPDASAGCLLDQHDDVVTTLFEAQYGPTP